MVKFIRGEFGEIRPNPPIEGWGAMINVAFGASENQQVAFPCRALIDTGAERTFVDAEIIRKGKFSQTPSEVGNFMGKDDVIDNYDAYLFLTFDSKETDRVTINVIARELRKSGVLYDAVIGLDILRHFHMSISRSLDRVILALAI